MRSKQSTKASAFVIRKSTNEKNQQLVKEIVWCKGNNERGQIALKTGLFTSLNDRETINLRLNGKIINTQERSYGKILTDDEEESIVAFIKNKNRWMRALIKEDPEKLITTNSSLIPLQTPQE